jgi:CheY-like chemotaxis protein
LKLETDASKTDRETEIGIFTNVDKAEEKSRDKVSDHHAGSNCSSSRIRSGWLPELVISAPTPFVHSLSTSCLSTTYPTPSSQGYQFSKDQEEVQYDSTGDKPDGVKLYDESYFPCKKRGPISETVSSFSSTGTSLSPEIYKTQTEVILSLLSGDLDIDVKDEVLQVLNPLSPRKASTAPLPSSAPLSVCAVEVTEKGFDILVVDDSKLNRKMLCKVLRSKGHVCDEADDGLKAVQKVKERLMRNSALGKNSFDAILMDFVMPLMDGPTGI